MSSHGAPVLIVSGPSGVGKGTAIRALIDRRPDVHLAVSATTRPPRPGELDGEHYHFISDQRFAQLVEQGAFLEHAAYGGRRYGTLASELQPDRPTLIECEVAGAAQIRERLPGVLSVFLAPPSLTELEQRLRGRGTETPEQIRTRLDRARAELTRTGEYTHIVTADTVERVAAGLDGLLDGPAAQLAAA